MDISDLAKPVQEVIDIPPPPTVRSNAERGKVGADGSPQDRAQLAGTQSRRTLGSGGTRPRSTAPRPANRVPQGSRGWRINIFA